MELKVRTTEEIRQFKTGFNPSHLDGETWVNLKNINEALTSFEINDKKLIEMLDNL